MAFALDDIQFSPEFTALHAADGWQHWQEAQQVTQTILETIAFNPSSSLALNRDANTKIKEIKVQVGNKEVPFPEYLSMALNHSPPLLDVNAIETKQAHNSLLLYLVKHPDAKDYLDQLAAAGADINHVNNGVRSALSRTTLSGRWDTHLHLLKMHAISPTPINYRITSVDGNLDSQNNSVTPPRKVLDFVCALQKNFASYQSSTQSWAALTREELCDFVNIGKLDDAITQMTDKGFAILAAQLVAQLPNFIAGEYARPMAAAVTQAIPIENKSLAGWVGRVSATNNAVETVR